MMKHVKLLGLIAVAAMALMALLGVGTASATVLCKTATGGLECGEAWKYSGTLKGTLAPGTSAVLWDTSNNVLNTCTGGSAEGTASAGGASSTVTGTAPLSSLSLTGCSSTAEVVKGCEGEIHSISGTSSGTATLKGCEVKVTIFGVSCVYGPGEGVDVGVVEEGGSGAAAAVREVVSKQEGGFLCPSTAVSEASVVRTAPEGTLGIAPS
jgi:hypothetical protein